MKNKQIIFSKKNLFEFYTYIFDIVLIDIFNS